MLTYTGNAQVKGCPSDRRRQSSHDIVFMRSPLPRLTCKKEGDRRGSNPRPSLEPHSADPCFQALSYVAEAAVLSRFLCSQLHAVSTCCVLSGVRSGVNATLVPCNAAVLSSSCQHSNNRRDLCGSRALNTAIYLDPGFAERCGTPSMVVVALAEATAYRASLLTLTQRSELIPLICGTSSG
jgi:hypothetical protein